MDFPILNNWTSPFPILMVWASKFRFIQTLIEYFVSKHWRPWSDVWSGFALCLPISHKKDVRFKCNFSMCSLIICIKMYSETSREKLCVSIYYGTCSLKGHYSNVHVRRQYSHTLKHSLNILKLLKLKNMISLISQFYEGWDNSVGKTKFKLLLLINFTNLLYAFITCIPYFYLV